MTQQERKYKLQKIRKRLRPAHVIVLGFLGVILLGAVLLCLPVSARDRKAMNFLNALFTSTSAVCVTGLTVVETGSHFSFFGQAVLLLLIQIGGLGFMSLTTLFMLLLRKKITLKDRLVMKEALNQEENRGLVRLTRNILIVTFSIEAVGFLLLLYPFVYRSGGKGVWYAAFTSISAFCNAGFDVFGQNASLLPYAGNVMVNLSVAFLVVLGGLGFTVLMDICHNRGNFRKFSLHTKIVLFVTLFLIGIGWAFFLGAEYTHAFAPLKKSDRVLAAFFQSITPRTAGFATVDQNTLSPAGKFFSMMLMFVGASPGSTGGGIKTTTFTILLLVTLSGIRRTDDITIGKRKVGKHNARKAVGLFLLGALVVIVSTMLLLLTERGHAADKAGLLTLENVLFESFSAFGTVGLSCGLTPHLTVAGKIILMFSMFFGRVGLITVGLLFVHKRNVTDKITYPEGNIMIG